MSLPLVSVVIPAFNAERHFPQAIESVLAQTYRNIEVIIVGDGSTDETPQLARAYARRDSRIRVFRQDNAGVGAARNRGMAEARGEFIAPLDADDFWNPEKLEKQTAVLVARGERWGFAYCWSNSVDREGTVTEPIVHWPVEGEIFEALIYRNIIGNASVPLFRASALREVGGYLTRADQGGVQGCEDWDLSLRLAAKYSVAAVPEFLVAYRQIAGTMSSNFSGMASSYQFAMSGLRHRHPEVPPRLYRWSSGHFFMYLLNTAYTAGNYPECFRMIRHLLAADATMILCPTIYRVFIVGLLRMLTGREILRRTRRPQTGWTPRQVLWIPAQILEARRWGTIKHGTKIE